MRPMTHRFPTVSRQVCLGNILKPRIGFVFFLTAAIFDSPPNVQIRIHFHTHALVTDYKNRAFVGENRRSLKSKNPEQIPARNIKTDEILYPINHRRRLPNVGEPTRCPSPHPPLHPQESDPVFLARSDYESADLEGTPWARPRKRYPEQVYIKPRSHSELIPGLIKKPRASPNTFAKNPNASRVGIDRILRFFVNQTQQYCP
jgi:hypothetical protein